MGAARAAMHKTVNFLQAVALKYNIMQNTPQLQQLINHGSNVISKDPMDKYHMFVANLHVTVGLMSGRTLLPLPPKEATNDRTSSNNKDRVHVLESAVITWTKQISHVLQQDPEALIKDGNNPDPLAELAFWRNKATNLNVIHAQLQSDQLKKVLKFLEQNKSTYTNPFSKLQKEVEQARDEATDNDHFLKPLKSLFDNLVSESADFEKLDEYIA